MKYLAFLLIFSIFILSIMFLFIGTISAQDCLYLQYHFNNESEFTLFDYSNNFHDATIYGGSNFTDGKLGKALRLDGLQYFSTDILTDDYFNYTKSFSFSFWFKNLENGRMILLARLGDAKGFAMGDYYGALTFGLWSPFDTGAIMVATQDYGLVNDGLWHHIVYTYDGSSSAYGMKIYYDNSLKPVDIFVENNLVGDTVSNASFGSAYGEQQTWGYIDEMQIYNFELNISQIRTLYNFGSGTENNLCTIISPPIFYNGSADTSAYLTYFCIDNTTIKGNGTYQNQLIEVYKNCQYGCDQQLNICYPSPLATFGIVILGIIAFIFIIIIFKKLVGRSK